MIDIKLIRDQLETVKTGVIAKGYPVELVEEVVKFDQTHRDLLVKTENLRAERNKLTKTDLDRGKQIKDELKALEPQLVEVQEKLQAALM